MELTIRTPWARQRVKLGWSWIGLLPFFGVVILFLLYPAVSIFVRSFTDAAGHPTIQNILDLNQPVIVRSYTLTIEASLITSVLGGIIGFALAWGISLGGLPDGIRRAVLSFSGVSSNFAGVPLVFAFISTIGQLGIVTQFLKSGGVFLYPTFSLYSFWGLCLVYTYFQIPLMTLLVLPALEGLRREWEEAASNLGASKLEYWRYVALPILAPSVLGAMTLLFANAFGAHATAYALVGGGGGANMIVAIMVGNQFSTDTFSNPQLGNALALGMIFVIAINIIIYTWLRRRAERWQAH